MDDERVAGGYLIVQGVGGLLWWVLLYRSPTVREWFTADAGWPVVRSLVAADLVAFGAGSVIAGWAVLYRLRWAGAAVVALTAITAYATLIAGAWIAEPVDRSLGFVAMVAALLATIATARTVRAQ